MFISSKEKDDYLTGTTSTPSSDDPTYKWKMKNNIVMSWLINSMNNDFWENFLLYATTNQIWEAAKDTYSNRDNTPEMFGIESTLHDAMIGGKVNGL